MGGGIVGAVTLVCVSVILILLVSGAGASLPFIGHVIETWTRQWTLEGIYTVFITASFMGFILGAFFSKKHLQVVQKWFSSALILGIAMTFCLWLFYGYASHVEFPRNLKLADCTNTTTIHLKVPKGRYYRLVLTMPSGSTNVFSGRINISDGVSTVTNLSIGFNQMEQQCNFFHAQSNYDINITFDQPPPPSTSIWLHWLQAYKDRDR